MANYLRKFTKAEIHHYWCGRKELIKLPVGNVNVSNFDIGYGTSEMQKYIEKA